MLGCEALKTYLRWPLSLFVGTAAAEAHQHVRSLRQQKSSLTAYSYVKCYMKHYSCTNCMMLRIPDVLQAFYLGQIILIAMTELIISCFAWTKLSQQCLPSIPHLLMRLLSHSPDALLQQPVAELHKCSFPMATSWDF